MNGNILLNPILTFSGFHL